MFDPGIDIRPTDYPLGFRYGTGCCGPPVEIRRLDDIRHSLRDPNCSGPEEVYAIAMDVSKTEHQALLRDKFLLFGVVTYAAGRLGKEPVRSQGHIHKVSPHCGWSTPEVYEIWSGEAIIYMQESAEDVPGRCFAVRAGPGQVVVVPPYWAHATISANAREALTFGAWCDRQYGFEYDGVRRHGGLAWFPLAEEHAIAWEPNQTYAPSRLIEKEPGDYRELGLESGVPIYTQFERHPDRFDFVPYPEKKAELWKEFTP